MHDDLLKCHSAQEKGKNPVTMVSSFSQAMFKMVIVEVDNIHKTEDALIPKFKITEVPLKNKVISINLPQAASPS